jgi:hypothetical protein
MVTIGAGPDHHDITPDKTGAGQTRNYAGDKGRDRPKDSPDIHVLLALSQIITEYDEIKIPATTMRDQ